MGKTMLAPYSCIQQAFALRARASDRWRATKKHKTCFAAVVWTQRRFELIGLAAWSPGGYAGTAKASYCSALKSVKGPWLQSDSLSRFSPALCSGVRASLINKYSALKAIKGTSRKLRLSTYFKAFALQARASVLIHNA